jgi:integrase
MKNKKKNEIVPVNVPGNSLISFEISMAQKRYSQPKLYIPRVNGKPSVATGKRWYVSFYWRTDPKGPLDRKFSFTKKINRLKTVKERKMAGNHLVSILTYALERGWVPDKAERNSVKSKKRGPNMNLGTAVDYAYKIKLKSGRKPSTLNGYEFHKNRFLEWAKNNGYYGLDPARFGIDQFYEFLDWLRFDYVNENTGREVSGSSVNNHKGSLSALFTTMKNERLIPFNFIKDIPDVEAEPVNNKAFTMEELQLIKDELEKTDPYLKQYMAFVIYSLLRPLEICRLKVKDLNTKNWLLQVETKTEDLSVRRIIEKLKPTIKEMELEKYPPSYNLFSNKDQPADWDASLKTMADHFGKRFRVVKTRLGFGREYGIYSARHTAIMNLYNSLVDEGKGEMEILFQLMPITQHRSIAGIKNYLRKHKKSIPPDHSNIFTLDF